MFGKKVETLTDHRKKGSFGRFLRRFFLFVFTLALLICGALVLIMNTIFNGPLETSTVRSVKANIRPSDQKF